MTKQSYDRIADVLALDIASGRLAPGERLPPLREFAFKRGIAPSTAERVYAELRRRGLTTGEVGRGTFVRSNFSTSTSGIVDPNQLRVDLEVIFPVLPDQDAILRPGIERAMRKDTFREAMFPISARATLQAREIAARFLSRRNWPVTEAQIVFAGNGRQGIAAALAALAAPGDQIGVEPITYPVIKGIASRLGLKLVPVPVDDNGIIPEKLAATCRANKIRALYLQPTLHNPLGTTLSKARREHLANVLSDIAVVAIEDAIYGFLTDDAPLAHFAPDHVVHVDSLSKRIAPGLSLGLIVAPARLVEPIADAARAGGWAAPGFSLAVGLQWLADGTAVSLAGAKRKDASERQALAARALKDFSLRRDPRAYHLWLELPEHWRADSFCAAALQEGISVTPASAFCIAPGRAPNAIRIALASPPLDELSQALRTLVRLAKTAPRSFVE